MSGLFFGIYNAIFIFRNQHIFSEMNLATANQQTRIELRTTDSVMKLLSRAASLNGTDMSSFILACAMEKAHQILEEHNSISLSYEGQLALLKALKNPGKPTQEMKNLLLLPSIEQY